MLCRNDELGAAHQAVLDDIVVDEGPSRRLHDATPLPVARRVGHAQRVARQVIVQQLDGALQAVHEFDAAGQVKEEDGVGRIPPLGAKARHVLIRDGRAEHRQHIQPRQRVGAHRLPLVEGAIGIARLDGHLVKVKPIVASRKDGVLVTVGRQHADGVAIVGVPLLHGGEIVGGLVIAEGADAVLEPDEQLPVALEQLLGQGEGVP